MQQNKIELPYEGLLNIATFSRILDLDKMTNSYKIYWFAAIFDEIKNENKAISFKRLVHRMIIKSWYSLLEFKLFLGKNDQLSLLVHTVQEISGLSNAANDVDILNFLENNINIDIERKITNFYNYVPFRLLTPFYTFNANLPDYLRNDIIRDNSQQNNIGIYRINNDNSITINDNWYFYLIKNQPIIEEWINYKLVYFLQKRNLNTPNIIGKLNPPVYRDLTDAVHFFRKLNGGNNIVDIYTQTAVDNNDISIDHFIPWSFVLHDNIWNLTPTSNSINSSKSNKLPTLKKYFNGFAEMQLHAYRFAIEQYNYDGNNYLKHIKEDYLTFTKGETLNETAFKNLLKQSIQPLYQLALNQGFTEMSL